MTTLEKTVPQISLIIDQEKDGVVEPRVLCKIQPNEAAIKSILMEMINPQYVVTISSKREVPYGDGTDYAEYQITSLQTVSVERPYAYISFARPDINRVSVRIVDVSNSSIRKSLDRQAQKPREAFFNRDTGSLYVDPDWDMSQIEGCVEIEVPEELFAKPPAKWQQTLVGRFFESKAVDQCVTRRRVMIAGLIELLVQTLGLLVRPVCAIGVILFGCRDIRWKSFFSIRITALWEDSGYSRWYTDNNDEDRDDWRTLVNPVTAVGGVAILFGLAGIVFALFHIPVHIGSTGKTRNWIGLGWWDTVLWTFGVGAVLALAVVCVLGGAKFVSAYRIKRRQSTASDLRVRQEAQKASQRQRLIKNVQQAAQAEFDWSDIPNKTVSLRFNRLKTRVCKPYAQ